MLEACKVEQYDVCFFDVLSRLVSYRSSETFRHPFSDDQQPRPADWEKFVDDLGRLVCEEQSPAR